MEHLANSARTTSNNQAMSATPNQKIARPALWKLALEGRAFFDLGAYLAALPILKRTQCGDGHPVMVLPGFLTDDTVTFPLRYFLQQRGYSPHRWKMGRNVGKTDIELPLIKRIKRLHKWYGKKVSLVGWSLGGVYARMLAQTIPSDIRSVITLGSPFSGITEPNNISWAYELLSGKKVEEIDVELVNKINGQPPIPTTAIYSKTDGVVAWQHCKHKQTHPLAEDVEVYCSHSGLGHNPLVLNCIVNRLAQPEGTFTPFRPKLFNRLLYP